MKKKLYLSIVFISSIQAMEEDVTKVKIPSREVIKQKFEDMDLDIHFFKRELQPIYDMAGQEQEQKEVERIIDSIVSERGRRIQEMDPEIPVMRGLDSLHRREFRKILLED